MCIFPLKKTKQKKNRQVTVIHLLAILLMLFYSGTNDNRMKPAFKGKINQKKKKKSFLHAVSEPNSIMLAWKKVFHKNIQLK